MLCPCCGFEMESGYLRGSRVSWTPKLHSGTSDPMYDGDFYVIPNFWDIGAVESHFCPHCKVVITRPDKKDLDKRIKKGAGVML